MRLNITAPLRINIYGVQKHKTDVFGVVFEGGYISTMFTDDLRTVVRYMYIGYTYVYIE